MEKVFEHLLKPFADWIIELFQSFGLSEGTSKTFAGALAALLVSLILILLKKLTEHLENNRSAKDLKPEFDYLTIKHFRDIYIPARYARISPNRYDNPDDAYKHDEPRKLIPFMLNKSFNERIENEKYYLILGDSGMGKTAFMVNLYMTFYSFGNSFLNSFRVFGKRQNMKLFRFQPPEIDNPVDIIDRIKAIKEEEAKNTILLLDGLDEDPFILSKDPALSDDAAFENRLNQIISSTRNFCDVVITCRTQYFPQEERKDYELNVRKPEGGFYKLNKYYLFPFSKKDVRKYLRKKYGLLKFWEWPKKRKGNRLVLKSHKLMSRPMLLSYLDDLMIEAKDYQFSYQIYETLIQKWLDRESKKWKKSEQQAEFKLNLRKLARETSLQIYQNWRAGGGLYLSKVDALKIARTHQISLEPDEVKGKSLLTCDPYLNWKFAHKSILEYFLALECFENWDFSANFKFAGMDMTEHFYREMAPVNSQDFVKIAGGTFIMGSPTSESKRSEERETQHSVKMRDFFLAKYLVTQKQWQEIMETNPSHFKSGDNYPVENVNWYDVQEFITKLNRRTGQEFRLPTEAEWEYACRAGTTTPFNTGDNLTAEQANYDGNGRYKNFPKGKYLGKTTPVGSYPPNAWGLYDMHGNVLEWCQDWFDLNYYEICKKMGIVENPTGPENGSQRVLRGGGCYLSAQDCRSANRANNDPAHPSSRVGFRLVSGVQATCFRGGAPVRRPNC